MASTDAPPVRATNQPILAEADHLPGLRRFNVFAFVAHLASAIGVIAIANDFSLPVNASWAQGPPGTSDIYPAETLVSIPLAWGAASFALLSALAHLLVATAAWKRYASDLTTRGINQLRWLEYALSSSLMIFLIAQLVGIYDLAALVTLVGANAAMIMFGWQMELHNADRRASGQPVRWSAFVFGCVAGIIPWIAIGSYLLGAPEVPGFAVGIFVSIFALFNVFTLVMWLEYRGIGRLRHVVSAERAYIVLSLTAKVALTWQVAINVLLD